jgi:hypothetical protein
MRDSKYAHAYGLLSDILNNVQFDISYDGVDYVGKRFFLDVYVKDVMMLLYASGASEKHWDTMKIAILEDVTLPLFMPLKHQNSSDREYSRFANMTTSARFDEIIKYIDEVKDHFIKDYYGEGWQNELACYIAYAVTSSLDDPREDIQGLLRHLQTKYSVSRERVESVATDIQRKIDRNDLKGNSLLL